MILAHSSRFHTAKQVPLDQSKWYHAGLGLHWWGHARETGCGLLMVSATEEVVLRNKHQIGDINNVEAPGKSSCIDVTCRLWDFVFCLHNRSKAEEIYKNIKKFHMHFVFLLFSFCCLAIFSRFLIIIKSFLYRNLIMLILF